ncbi:MAG: type III pantothenate kinase [Bacteroidetes bacterium]|nr:type III pantothenate kinase [Bacteroidota bacterium]
MAALICIDIGNQNLKFAKFSAKGELIEHKTIPNSESISIIESLRTQGEIIISDVSGITDKLTKNDKITFVNSQTKLPFKISYQTPHTLGTDRLCGLAGALYLNSSDSCLVFNMGTCLTIDFVDENKIYSGGNISPGLSLRYKSLNQYTAKLPLLSPTLKTSLIGVDTQTAISNGVQNGILAELEFYINHFSKQSNKLNIFLTGGDAVYFEKKLKTKIFAAPLLNLYGLFNIAKINGII